MGGKKKHDLSGKDFRTPLLDSIAALSGGFTNATVPFKETFDPVCKALGITYDQYGVRDSDGKSWVLLWIFGAHHWLKSKGLVSSQGRGKWGITAEGLAKAGAASTATATPAAAGVPDQAPVTAPVTATLGVAKVDDDTTPVDKGVSYPVSIVLDASGYHPDPYIRTLAAKATACFGKFSPRAGSACTSCTLADSCQNLVASHLSRLAAELAAADVAEELRLAELARQAAMPKVPVAPTAPKAAAAAPAPPASGKWDNTGAVVIICCSKADCYRCGKPIQTDASCYWKQDSGTESFGLFHPNCK